MKQYEIAAVPIPLIEYVWPDVEPHIQKVVDVAHGEIDCNTIKQKLLDNGALLVLILDGESVIAANTIEIRTFDTGHKVLCIPITGGEELDGWLVQFMDYAKKVAREHGCKELRGIAVRRGWVRKLKPLGWEEHSVIIGCNLGEEE